jgi:alkylation response protein AidB-like acyl-CoA dehydrogenase
MDELLTLEQRSFRARIREVCDREVAPRSAAIERGEVSPYECFPGLRKAGLFAGRLAREHGGGGLSNVEAAIVGIELARACTATTMAAGASAILCGGAIARSGTEEQKRRWLTRLASGEAKGAWGLTEPGAGSDVAGLATRAAREGSEWVITGQKTFITNAPFADVVVVYARTEPKGEDPHQGITSFILEKGDPGLSLGPPMKKLGMNGSPTGEVFMDRCRVPLDRLLGTEGNGFYQAVDVLNDERAGLPSIGCGIARRALDEAWRELRESGAKPDSAAASLLARDEARLSRVLAQLLEVCEARDRGEEDPIAASAVKLAAGEASCEIALDCARALGLAGVTTSQAAERALRDAKLLTIGGGTSEIQKTLVARRLFGG